MKNVFRVYQKNYTVFYKMHVIYLYCTKSFMVSSVMYTICEGPNLDVSKSQSVTSIYWWHVILFVNISSFLK